MICQICKKNPATVHVQEIVGGKKNTLHLCASCADKKAMLEPFLHGTDLNSLIKDMMGMIQNGGPEAENAHGTSAADKPEHNTVCPFCSWSLEQWQKTGRFGCERCYTVFGAEIDAKLPSMHRGIVHKGKTPPGMEDGNTVSDQVEQDLALIRELKQLRNDLQGCIRREEYEIAARVRDKIAELEQLLAEKGVKV
ncbi:MAG: UvrB/UvrC motif-containing protein [Lentisphaeria bacterium]|nr:UvrB/UvrC motif-containing protein [Lentisphaeria bacterium]